MARSPGSTTAGRRTAPSSSPSTGLAGPPPTCPAHPTHVRGLALIGPALPRPRTSVPGRALAKQVALFAVPGVAERSLARRRTRLGAEAFVQATLELTCADASKVSPEMRRLAVQLSEERANGPDGEQAFLEAARSLAVLVTRSAAYRGVLASVTAPGIVLQGKL